MLQECSGWQTLSQIVEWDMETTDVISSKLVIVHCVSDRDPIDVKIKFNGVEVEHFFWGEGTKNTPKSSVIEVSVTNGINVIEMRSCKHYYWVGNVGVTCDGYIEITYTGEEPEEPPGEWLKKHWLELTAGVVVFFAVSKYIGGKK